MIDGLFAGVKLFASCNVITTGVAAHIGGRHNADRVLPIPWQTESRNFRRIKVRRIVFLKTENERSV